MRTFRPASTAFLVAAFLVVCNLILLWLLPAAAGAPGSAADEAWLLYYAVVYEDRLPERLDTDDLRRLLLVLHPDAEAAANRFSLRSYTLDGADFVLEVEHLDGSVFRITRAGVGGG